MAQKIEGGTARAVTHGTAYAMPVGVVAVWFMNTYCLEHPMPSEIGVAFGSLVSAAAMWAVQWLPERKRQ